MLADHPLPAHIALIGSGALAGLRTVRRSSPLQANASISRVEKADGDFFAVPEEGAGRRSAAP